MLPHAHFQHELPELPTISCLHLDYPYAQAAQLRVTAGAHHDRSSIAHRSKVKHSQGQPGPNVVKEYGT